MIDEAPLATELGPSLPVVRRPRASLATLILAILAVAYTLAIAREFLLPIALAWLAKSALAPTVRWLGRLHVPGSLAAALVLLSLVGAIGYGIYSLSGPASQWARRLPEDAAEIGRKLKAGLGDLASPLDGVSRASAVVQELAQSRPESSRPVEVAVVHDTSATASVLSGLQDFAANGAIVLILLYFILATQDTLLAKVVELLPKLKDKKAAVATARAIESSIARYLITITAIYGTLGVAVGLVSWFFGLPNPALWGVVAALAAYVPYVGPVIGILAVAAVGLSVPDSTVFRGLAPAIAYAVLNTIEGLLITPVIVGRRLALSPVLVFVWLLLLSWLWGIPGALIAVPLLASAKIVCDNVERLQPLGRLLST